MSGNLRSIFKSVAVAAMFVVPSLASSQTSADSAAAARVADSVAAAAAASAATTTAEPQQHAEAGEHAQEAGGHGGGDFITPHVTDSRHIELPYWKGPTYSYEWEIPRIPVIHLGGFELDISPTKHVVFMLIAAALTLLTLVGAARSSTAGHKMIGRPKGFASAIEASALYLRNEVVLPNIGPHGEKFVPFALTMFYFILWCNLLGLFPYGSTATGNVSVTGMLALLTLVVVEITGMRTLGAGYLGTIFYWNKDLPLGVRIPMFVIMTPVEIIGKLSKPFALAIRLFANMTAGHIVLLALIGLIFTFKSYYIAVAPVGMAVAISMLELFVSFLQAFIFTMLVSVLIGQMRVAHH